MVDERTRILSIIREVYGRVAWTHKTLEKDREILSGRAMRNRWANIIILSITATGVLTSIPLDALWLKIGTAITALISTGYAIYDLSFPVDIEILQYRIAAKKLLIERDKLLLLIEKAMATNVNLDEIRAELTRVIERTGEIYSSSPDTTSKGHSLATQGLKSKEELTFSQDEIDSLLPAQLRLSGADKSSAQQP